MSNVWLHIGLPKTATTTLQKDLFESGSGRWWTYGGVLQSRNERVQPGVHASLWDTLFAQSDWQTHALILQKHVNGLLAQGLPVLLSEECATIDAGVPWQEKLRRLSWTFRGHQLHTLVGVREPTSGLQSLFVERYPAIKERYPSIDKFINSSNEAKIFIYDELFEILDNEFQAGCTHLLYMEELGAPSWWEFWERHFGLDAEKRPKLEQRNVTRKGPKSATTDPVSVGRFLNDEVATRLSTTFNRGGAVYGLMRRIYRRINVRNWNSKLLQPRYSVSTTVKGDHERLSASARYLKERLREGDNAC